LEFYFYFYFSVFYNDYWKKTKICKKQCITTL